MVFFVSDPTKHRKQETDKQRDTERKINRQKQRQKVVEKESKVNHTLYLLNAITHYTY